MDRSVFEGWQLEAKQIEDLITDVERAQRAFLDSIGVPSDPVLIYAILAGERPAPWPKRTAARDKRRALHAMHTLVWLAKARQHVRFGAENSRLAAHAGLIAGLHANNAAEHAALAMTTRTNNSRAGSRRWAHLKERDAEWWQAARRYRMQHPHATSRVVAAAVKRSLQCAESVETIRARLRTLAGRVGQKHAKRAG